MSVNSRYNSRSCNYEGSKPYTQSNLNKIRNAKKLPKTFASLMPNLAVLIQDSVKTYFGSYSKEGQDLVHFLTSFYDQTATQTLTTALFGGKTPTEAMNIINKHIDIFKIPEGTKKTKRYGPRQITNTFDLTLGGKGKENTSDFAYLMMLDMQHDETIPNTMSFEEFCQDRITLKEKNGQYVERRSPVSYFFGGPIVPIQTDFKTRMEDITGRGKGGKGSEKAIKESFEKLHNKESIKRTLTNYKHPSFLKPGTLLYLLLDQEDKAATGTRVIESHNKVRNTLLNKNNTQTKITSAITPLFTVPNLTDPGASMLILGAKEASHLLMVANNPKTGGLVFNTSKPTFIIKHAYGTTKLEYYYSTNLKEEFNNARNISGNKNKKPTQIEKRQFGYGILISNDIQKMKYNTKREPSCKIRVPAGITKNIAQADTRSTIKLGKFFGDFMQGLTALSINDTVSPGGTQRKFALATGDAMLGNMYMFMGKVTNKKPRMMFIMSKETNLKLFGFDDVLNDTTPNRPVAKTTQTAANSENVAPGNPGNYNSNANSQQKRGTKRSINKNSAKNSNSNAINVAKVRKLNKNSAKNSNSNAINVAKVRKLNKNSAKESSNNSGVKPMNVNSTRKPTPAFLLAEKRKKTQEQIAKQRRNRNLMLQRKKMQAVIKQKNARKQEAAILLNEKRKIEEKRIRERAAVRAQEKRNIESGKAKKNQWGRIVYNSNKSPPKIRRLGYSEQLEQIKKNDKKAKARTAKITGNNRIKSGAKWRTSKNKFVTNKLLENKYKSLPDARRKASKQLRKMAAATPMKTKGATPFRGSNGQYLNKYDPRTAKTHKQLVALMTRAENKAVSKGASRRTMNLIREANSSSNSNSNSNSNTYSNSNSNSNSNNNNRR